MRLRFNQNSELFFPDFGVYKPKQVKDVKDDLVAKDMLATGYFDEVKEIKRKVKVRKSKKKGDVLNAHRDQVTYRPKKRDNLG